VATSSGAVAQDVDTLLRHGRIITMDPERRILTDGAIAIKDGRIVAIGPDRDIAPAVSGAQVRDLAGAMVHPGFVDAHVHTSMDIIRGLLVEGRDWSSVEIPYVASLTAVDEYLTAMVSCMEMVANGITIYAGTGEGLSVENAASAIELTGMRGIPGRFIADVAGELEGWYLPTEVCLERLAEQLERYPFRGSGRVRCAVTLSGMGSASDRLLTEAKALADRAGVPMLMHQSWGEDEVEACLARHGKRPIEHLDDLGILGPNLTLVHMIHLNRPEVDLLARSGTRVVHCPAAAARRAMGAFRVGRFKEMLEAGVVVGLGSDGDSGKRDLARQVYLAAVIHREVHGEVPFISAQTALEMATLGSARAIGLQDEIGSLEVGKRADLVIHTVDRPEARPRFRNPVANLVYFAQSQTVDTVLVDGEVILEHGQFARFDQREAFARIDTKTAALEKQLGVPELGAWPLVD
jgi:cytosine/adenosine deaminase-related metal-dependent hydrolase